MFHESADILHVEVVELDGAAIVVAELPVHVSNPAREAAMAACVACGGVWGMHGLRYHDGCNCKARDAGQPCHDGGACEGACKFDRWEISQPAEPARCKGKLCSGPAPAIGHPVRALLRPGGGDPQLSHVAAQGRRGRARSGAAVGYHADLRRLRRSTPSPR